MSSCFVSKSFEFTIVAVGSVVAEVFVVVLLADAMTGTTHNVAELSSSIRILLTGTFDSTSPSSYRTVYSEEEPEENATI